jgi:alpha-1,2-mannosyltransferase
MQAVASHPWFLWLQQRWFVLGLSLIFVLLSVQYSGKVLDSHRSNRSAFLRWRDQILELQDGVNIWEKYNYPNPPIMVLILEPLVQLPPLLGSLVWFYLKVGMTLAAIFLAFRLVETPGQPWPLWAKALAVALSLRPIMGDLSHGNVNLFILILCVAALACFRWRRDATAGVLVALAIACKVTPALMVPYFLWKRSWKLLAGCAAGLVLFFWLIPGLFLGFQQNQACLLSWYNGMIKPFAVDGKVTTDHENQSLPGLVHRMVTDSASFSAFIDEQYTPLEKHNFVAWEPSVARNIVRLCMAAFACLVVWVCRNPTNDRQRWQLAAEYGLILLGMLLFSERTWKHHCVTLLVPFCVLCYYLATARPERWTRQFVIAMLIAAAVLMTATTTGWSSSLERVGKLAQVYGAYVWANLALTAALVVVLRQQRDGRRATAS